ncbi:Barwin [Corchorus capsularis]|uniref:Barwin n=1 Tax=Corchorus capsularis TaxID=210143 RepID=A0A1R3HNM6_COCAP|nr:Barwin [Corchorus capsularis]
MKKTSLSILLLASLVGFAAAQSGSGGDGPGESNVTAYWTDYNATHNNWDFNASHVSCARILGRKPLEWRKKYGWTGFCGSVGPQGDAACGLCLRVTNYIDNETKAEEKVRIVDACGGAGALELDFETAFMPIDIDGNGNSTGHLNVDYNFMDCDDSDELENTLLVSSL